MNIKYLIKQDVRNMIIDHLRRMGSFEHYSDEEIWDAMGYTSEDLIEHLEKQFYDKGSFGKDSKEPWAPMNWNKYRSHWVIAHDVPMSIHHFQTIHCYNFQEAWKLENIRPMWKEDFSSRAKHKKIILVDVDGTILTSDPNHDYMKSEPIKKRIDVINKLYDSGKYIIIYYTARGSVHDKDWYSVTKEQLQRVGAKFDILKTTKCYYDHQIDDRSWNDVHFFDDPAKFLEF